MISKPNNGSLKTDDDVFNYYGLSKKEIEFIRDTLGENPGKTDKDGKGGSSRKTIKKGLRKRVGPVKTRRRKHKYPTKRTIKRNNSRGKSKTRRKRRY